LVRPGMKGRKKLSDRTDKKKGKEVTDGIDYLRKGQYSILRIKRPRKKIRSDYKRRGALSDELQSRGGTLKRVSVGSPTRRRNLSSIWDTQFPLVDGGGKKGEIFRE